MTYRGRTFAMPADIFGGNWPNGPAVDETGKPIEEPEYARYARHIAIALQAAIDERQVSVRDIGRMCGVHGVTIGKILKGTVLPDVVTLSRLETGLKVRLWPE